MKLKLDTFTGTRLHLIDVSAVARTKWWSFKDFSWDIDGKTVGTGAIYAVLSLFREIPVEDQVLFCFDFGGNVRQQEDSGYKASRSSKGLDDYFKQISELREILVSCGFEIFGQTGYEADDFIAGAVEAYKDKFDHVFIYTNDEDLGALVDNNVYLRSVLSKKSDVTRGNFEKEFGIPYNSMALYKATVGCSSDEVKGIYRFGKAKFSKFIQEVGKEYNLELVRKENMEEEILKNYPGFNDEQRDQALQSLRLVLPRIPNGYHFEDLEYNVDIDLFKWYLGRYGMKSILEIINKE